MSKYFGCSMPTPTNAVTSRPSFVASTFAVCPEAALATTVPLASTGEKPASCAISQINSTGASMST